MFGKVEHGIAENPAHLRFRRNEVRRPAGIENVLVGAVNALHVIGIQQAFRRKSAHYQFQLPDQVVGILQAGIGTARAEGRNLMRRVARKQYPPMAELLHPPALERVDRNPFQFEPDVRPQHGLEPGDHVFRQFLLFLVDVPAELQVDAPDPIRLLVQKGRLPPVERRVEPEPALGGKIGIHHHIGNQEIVLEDTTDEIETHHGPDRRTGTVTGNQPVCLDPVGPIRRFDGQ